MAAVKIAILGSEGRMGSWVKNLIASQYAPDAEVTAEVDQGDSPASLYTADIVIDFSSPQAVLGAISHAPNGDRTPAWVVGSTGWDSSATDRLRQFSRCTPVFASSNFSLGMMFFHEALKILAPLYTKFGYEPVIIEAHHKHKKDAPSGTACSLQKILSPAEPEQIQTHSIRAAEVVGEHEVQFFGPGEKIAFAHSAEDRSVFAHGAIKVAIWLHQKRSRKSDLSGMFGPEDFLREMRPEAEIRLLGRP